MGAKMNNGEYQDNDKHEEPEQGTTERTPDSHIQGSETGSTGGSEKAAESDDMAADENPAATTAFVSSRVELPDLSKFLPKMPDMSKYSPKMPDMSKFLPKMPDMSALFPKIELPNRAAAAFPKIDVTNLGVFPQTDVSKLFGPLPNLDSITGLIGLIDMPRVDFSGLLSGMQKTFEKIAEALPPNWPAEIDFDLAESILNDEGIPLVWVPRAEIITLMLESADRTARLQVLVDHKEDVLHDCRAALHRITHAGFRDQLPLAEKVIAVMEAGFDEPAQALAVTVTETAVAATISGNYGQVKKQVHLNFEEIPYTLMRIQAALAPIGVFYTSWYASENKPRPAELSRHVTVHAASIDHYTPANALVAVMLMASVLCALQELLEQADQQSPGA